METFSEYLHLEYFNLGYPVGVFLSKKSHLQRLFSKWICKSIKRGGKK